MFLGMMSRALHRQVKDMIAKLGSNHGIPAITWNAMIISEVTYYTPRASN